MSTAIVFGAAGVGAFVVIVCLLAASLGRPVQ